MEQEEEEEAMPVAKEEMEAMEAEEEEAAVQEEQQGHLEGQEEEAQRHMRAMPRMGRTVQRPRPILSTSMAPMREGTGDIVAELQGVQQEEEEEEGMDP